MHVDRTRRRAQLACERDLRNDNLLGHGGSEFSKNPRFKKSRRSDAVLKYAIVGSQLHREMKDAGGEVVGTSTHANSRKRKYKSSKKSKSREKRVIEKRLQVWTELNYLAASKIRNLKSATEGEKRIWDKIASSSELLVRRMNLAEQSYQDLEKETIRRAFQPPHERGAKPIKPIGSPLRALRLSRSYRGVLHRSQDVKRCLQYN